MQTIEDKLTQHLNARIQYHQDKIAHYKKQLATVLAIQAEIMQGDCERSDASGHDTGAAITPVGEFTNDSMKSAITKILEQRVHEGLPAPTTKELYDALTRGNFSFTSPDNYKKRMGALSTFLSRAKDAKFITRGDEGRISLTDNDARFV